MSIADVDTASTADGWEALVSASFVPLTVRRVDDAFSGSVSSVRLDSGSVSRVVADGTSLRRDLRAGGDEPGMLFVLHRRGRARVTQLGRVSEQEPGDSVLYVSDDAYTLDFEAAFEELVLHLPLAVLDTPERRVRQLASRTLPRSVHALALGGYAEQLLQAGSAGAEAQPLLQTVAYLADRALAVIDRRHVPQPDDVLRTRIHAYVRARYRNPDLTPERLAEVFGISRRKLYLLFEHEAHSPAAMIRALRVRHAMDLLLEQPAATQGAIAFEVGFRDPATFARAFARELGLSPSAVRDAARRGVLPQPDGDA